MINAMESSSAIDSDTLNMLQALLVQNPELGQLESLLDQFNIFEALGAVHQEVRHSDFLAFLLNPRQNHGLGDLFVKRLLQEAISQADFAQPITPIDLEIWDLDDIEVRREWQSIDILLLDGLHQLVVILENKIYSAEHDDQLKRYIEIVQRHYPAYRIMGIYLTPEGEASSDTNYIAISYSMICELIENLISSRATTLGQDVLVLIKHYVTMLRRYIVGESEIEKLCQQIYRKHQAALDLIFEYRIDQQAEIKEYLSELIEANPQMLIDHASKSTINFLPKNWGFPVLQQGQGWTRSGRMLLFLFTNLPDMLKLTLILGPGPDETRQKVFDIFKQHEPPFKRSFKALGKRWSTVYNRNFLTKNSYKDKNREELKDEIKQHWDGFLEHDLPKMEAILVEEMSSWGGKA